ncbi:MAG: META domain-containing protein [Bacteroidia bacterium]
MKFFLLAFISISLFSCHKNDAELEGLTWNVANFTNQDGDKTINGISCALNLSEGNANINLEVNSCFGTYNLGTNGQINFLDGFGCTEACCDEPESEEALRMITKCTQYSINGNTLTLSNSNGIMVILKKD